MMKPRVVNDRWHVVLPDYIADHPYLSNHERARFDSMASLLKPGMRLFDIGAECGACSAVYAQMVGPENLTLFEPTPELWPAIRRTWEANGYALPDGCWHGFLDQWGVDDPRTEVWPTAAYGAHDGPTPYRYLHDGEQSIPTTSVDQWCVEHEVVPDALTIDVEGAEARVLVGASAVLRTHRPVVWLSVHTDDMLNAHGSTRAGLFGLIERLGYRPEFLAVDHEEHFCLHPM